MTTTPTTGEVSLVRDPVTRDYVARVPAEIEIRMPADIYQRVWLNLATEEGIDLSNSDALAAHAYKVGRVSRWWDHTHATKTILPTSAPSTSTASGGLLTPPLAPEPGPRKEVGGPTVKQQRIDRLRLAAQTVPPSRWMDECRTPVPPEDVQGDPRRKVLRERTEEKYVLEWLYGEWKEGRFQISAEAEHEEFPSQERLDLLRAMTNGTRLDNGFHAQEEEVAV